MPSLQHAEFVGLVAGFGTTFAVVPDLIKMLTTRSSKGMTPTMPAILAVFQIIWIYYGVLIDSRPIVLWNIVAVSINSLTVAAYVHFTRRGR